MAMNVKETVNALIHFPVEEAILLCANHGVGKSAVVKMVTQKFGIPCIDFRLSQNDVGDLKGMPFRVGGRTIFAPPEFMPIAPKDQEVLQELLKTTEEISAGTYGKYGILFLDEINRANREVQQAAFELVLDRRLNLRSLPDGWRVVSAINGDDSIYTVGQMEPALLSRFFLIDFKPSKQEFLAYAEGKVEEYAKEKIDPKKYLSAMSFRPFHPAVLQFLKKYEDLIDPTTEQLQSAVAKGVVKVQDRRGWEKLSRTIHRYEDLYKAGLYHEDILKNLNHLHRIAAGFVGTAVAAKFRHFVENDFKTLSAKAILNNFNKEIKDHIKKVIDSGRYMELGTYNGLIVEYIAKNVHKNLSSDQKKNLTSYIKLVPNEIGGDLWKTFLEEHRTAAMDWYSSDTEASDHILNAFISPRAARN